MASDLPSTLSTPSTIDTGSIIQELGTDFFRDTQSEPGSSTVESSPSPAINQQALALAFLGWQAEAGHISGLAVCEACFRRLGLWLFKSRTSSSEGSEATTDGDKASMNRLDVVGEHRDYCPWINAPSQSGGGTPRKESSGLSELAGWEILARVIQNTAHSKAGIMQPPSTPSSGTTAVDDSASEAASLVSKAGQADVKALRDSKDKERWTKLRKLRQVFHIKDGKRLSKSKGKGAIQRPSTAG